MAKYRLLTKEGYPEDFFVEGKVYDGDDRRNPDCVVVSQVAQSYPEDWQKLDTIELDITAALEAGVQLKEIEMRLNLALMQLVAEKGETFNLGENN